VIPSLGRLGSHTLPIAGGDEGAAVTAIPRFSWRCRVCRTTMRPAQKTMLWKPRRPLSNWLRERAPSRA
jgi:hypothetical protein